MNHSNFHKLAGKGLPNLFLVGAPKCGTTALHSYLVAHPSIASSARKEFNYFNIDHTASYPYAVRDEVQYKSFFEKSTADYKIDASPWYLFSEVAASNIKLCVPQAKIIIMLRRPWDMLYSLHSQRLFSGNEDISSFSAALDAETARARGERIPRICQVPEGLQYRKVGLYAQQVERYIEAFGRDNVHIIKYDDFSADPRSEFLRVTRFLSIQEVLPLEFSRVNPNTVSRISSLAGIINDHHHPVRTAFRRLLPSSAVRKIVGRNLKKFNTKDTPRAPLDEVIRLQLREYFQSDIERLCNISGLDFGSWLSKKN